MDASIMNGRDMNAGAVSCLKGVQNPILAAKAVMENSGHVLLCGEGAQAFQRIMGLLFSEMNTFSQDRWEQLVSAREKGKVTLDHSENVGTVGAVALVTWQYHCRHLNWRIN